MGKAATARYSRSKAVTGQTAGKRGCAMASR